MAPLRSSNIIVGNKVPLSPSSYIFSYHLASFHCCSNRPPALPLLAFTYSLHVYMALLDVCLSCTSSVWLCSSPHPLVYLSAFILTSQIKYAPNLLSYTHRSHMEHLSRPHLSTSSVNALCISQNRNLQ